MHKSNAIQVYSAMSMHKTDTRYHLVSCQMDHKHILFSLTLVLVVFLVCINHEEFIQRLLYNMKTDTRHHFSVLSDGSKKNFFYANTCISAFFCMHKSRRVYSALAIQYENRHKTPFQCLVLDRHLRLTLVLLPLLIIIISRGFNSSVNIPECCDFRSQFCY